MDLSLLMAVFIDISFGELPNRFHPVFYIGKIIIFFEKVFYKMKNKVLGGFLIFVAVQSIALSLCYFVYQIISLKWHFFVNIFVIYSMISILEMKKSAMGVFRALLDTDLEWAKSNLKLIVSREVKNMKEKDIIKSTIESIAENFNDSVFAPLFFYTLFGIYGIVFYRVANTLDAMIGYRNEKYFYFGKFAAKIDDFLNFIPARLQLFPIVLASCLLFKTGKSAIDSFWKFRNSLISPNAGCGISLFAGALKVNLGGSAVYFGKVVEKPSIIGGYDNLTAIKIIDACELFIHSSLITTLLISIC